MQPAVAQMSVELAGEGGEENLGECVVGIGNIRGAEQDPQVGAPERVGAGAESGVAGLGGQGEIEVLVE